MQPSPTPHNCIFQLCSQIIKQRLIPSTEQQQSLAKSQLKQALSKNFKPPGSFYMDVSLLLPGNLQSSKIQQWYFGISPTKTSKTTFKHPITSQLLRMLKNISPQHLYAHNSILRTDFTFTTDHQTLSTLDSENTFEVPIDYFEIGGYGYTVTLTYNYEVEADGFVEVVRQEEKKLPEIRRETREEQETAFRKYSEGVQLVREKNITEGVVIQQAKLQVLRKKVDSINFSKIDSRTPRDILKTLHQQ